MRKILVPIINCFTDKPYTYIDRYGGSVGIDYEHSKIHDGDAYYISTYWTVANAGVIDLGIEVGANDAHFTYSVNSDQAGFTLLSYENVTFDADGSLLNLRNNNRTSANASTLKIRYNPSNVVITSATEIRKAYCGTGGNASTRSAGSINRNNEVIFKPGLKYLIRITNLSTSNNDIQFNAQYYETP